MPLARSYALDRMIGLCPIYFVAASLPPRFSALRNGSKRNPLRGFETKRKGAVGTKKALL